MPESKIFFSYESALRVLKISRRTLRRWMDLLEIEPMDLDGCRRRFLARGQVEQLVWYQKVRATGDSVLIDRYLRALEYEDTEAVEKIRSGL